MSGIFAALCLAAVLVLLIAERFENAALRWLAKPAASLGFIAVAISEGALNDGAFGALILVALIFCALGDVLLIPRGDRFFLAGMGAFALGHGVFIAAFLANAPQIKPLVFIAAFVMSVIAFFVLRTLWGKLGPMKAPVAAYVAVITAMVGTSFAASPAAGPAPGAYAWTLIAGATGFAASDIAVARDQFIDRHFLNRLWGLPLYYGAQLLLASSV